VCGIPGAFHVDHGSDFTSAHLEQVMADLKIRAYFSLPGQPRGRGKVERIFGTVNQMCLPSLLELGVHKAIDGGPMPTYVRRPHDEVLRAVLDLAVTASRLTRANCRSAGSCCATRRPGS